MFCQNHIGTNQRSAHCSIIPDLNGLCHTQSVKSPQKSCKLYRMAPRKSKSAQTNKSAASGPPIYNCYQPSNLATVVATLQTVVNPNDRLPGYLGAVRPHLASVSGSGSPVFENNKTFQIITGGKDGRFGGRLVALGAQWFTTTGKSYTNSGTVIAPVMAPDSASAGKFELTENNGILLRPAYDNAGNFTESKTLGDNAS